MNKKILFITLPVVISQIMLHNISFANQLDVTKDKIYNNYHYDTNEEKIEILLGQKDICLYELSPLNEEWSELTYSEQLEVCDMPEEFLSTCSTWDLSEYVLEYPFLLDIYAFDSTEQGINHLINTSNVCKEFFSRGDAKEVLLRKYDTLIVNYNLLSEKPNGANNLLSQSGYAKELFLQSYFGNNIDNLNMDEKEKLKNIISEKYEQKKGKCDKFATSLLIYDVIQQVKDSIPSEIVPNNIANDSLVTYSNEGFNEFGPELHNINGALCKVGMYNKYGTSAGCYKYVSGDYTSDEIAGLDQYIRTTHPSWGKIFSATKAYNCHSYAWLGLVVFNKYWINNPDFYANSSSFTKIGINHAAQAKDKIVIDGLKFQADGFGNTTYALHSVIVYSGGASASNIQTQSKLGKYGVYNASLNDMIDFYGGAIYRVYRKK